MPIRTETYIGVVGLQGSADMSARVRDDRIEVTAAYGGEIEAVCDMHYEDALTLGEWLIAQAIAHGAGRKAFAESGKGERDG